MTSEGAKSASERGIQFDPDLFHGCFFQATMLKKRKHKFKRRNTEPSVNHSPLAIAQVSTTTGHFYQESLLEGEGEIPTDP